MTTLVRFLVFDVLPAIAKFALGKLLKRRKKDK